MVRQVSVVVVNYNRKSLLDCCLKSLLGQSRRPDEIIVVDNGSSDGSKELVESLHFEGIRLIALEQNSGFAPACNRGIRASRGELVGLINNDAEAQPDWLERILVAVDQSPPNVGMWASKILLHGTSRIDKCGHLIFWDGQNRGRGGGEKDQGQYDGDRDALFPDGCAAVYRREILDAAGGFDEDFFAYGDDADLGLRIGWLGGKCRAVPEAVVFHRHSSTTGPYALEKVYLVERNRLWVAVKNFPLPLLALNPVFTVYRWLWNFGAALMKKGAAGEMRRGAGWWEISGMMGRATLDGVRGIPQMWAKRRRALSQRQISRLDFLRLLWRHRISARALAVQDPGRWRERLR